MDVCEVNVRYWRDAVRDAPDLDIACRGVLFLLTRWMNADGSNCYPGRARIAAYSGLSERQIDRYLAAALGAGYLWRTEPGYRGHNAVYRAVVPACRLDEEGKVKPVRLNVREVLAAREAENTARHRRRAKSAEARHDWRAKTAKARHDHLDSATCTPRQRDTGGAPPTQVPPTWESPTEELPPSEFLRTPPVATRSAESEHQQFGNDEAPWLEEDPWNDPWEQLANSEGASGWVLDRVRCEPWIDVTVSEMLSSGMDPKKVVATIRERQELQDPW